MTNDRETTSPSPRDDGQSTAPSMEPSGTPANSDVTGGVGGVAPLDGETAGEQPDTATPLLDGPVIGEVTHTVPAGPSVEPSSGPDGSSISPVSEPTEPAEETDETAEADERSRGQRIGRAALEWVLVIGGALLVAFVVKTFLVQAFWIPSPSMEPTLQENDRVLANKLADGISDLNRGDVIVFQRVEAESAGPDGDVKDLIKRVIGLPGDVVEARDGVVYVNGTRLDESYLEDGTQTGRLDEPVEVPEGHVFVMGDNRSNSHDSRNFGFVPDENIVGRAFVRIWPPSRLGRL